MKIIKFWRASRCCREDTFLAHPRLIRKQIASRRIHFHFGGHREEEEEEVTMANKQLPPGMRTFLLNISTHFDLALAVPSFLDLP